MNAEKGFVSWPVTPASHRRPSGSLPFSGGTEQGHSHSRVPRGLWASQGRPRDGCCRPSVRSPPRDSNWSHRRPREERDASSFREGERLGHGPACPGDLAGSQRPCASHASTRGSARGPRGPQPPSEAEKVLPLAPGGEARTVSRDEAPERKRNFFGSRRTASRSKSRQRRRRNRVRVTDGGQRRLLGALVRLVSGALGRRLHLPCPLRLASFLQQPPPRLPSGAWASRLFPLGLDQAQPTSPRGPTSDGRRAAPLVWKFPSVRIPLPPPIALGH